MRNYGFPSEFLEELRSRLNIVSVISRSVSLQRKGKTFWSCCPFHYEKTPSFAVNEEEQIFHCFGCGEGGNVFNFVMKYENVSFTEAVKILAKEAGMEVPKMQNNDEELAKLRLKEKALKALNEGTEFYKKCLFSEKGAEARNYAKSRGFDNDVIEDFAIGYSPDFVSLARYLKDKGFSDEVLLASGLCFRDDRGKLLDMFGQRLIFPIRNSFGDTIAFTARSMQANPTFAKYKNSAQNIVFDKSRVIYNIDSIKKLRKTERIDCIYICEGTIDVIAMHRAGIKNTVACMGTAITPYHARELKRYTDKVNLCLDGDSAGQHATFKAIDILSDANIEVRVVKLKENLDPDEYLKKYGKEELVLATGNTLDAIEYKILSIKGKYNISNSFEQNKCVQECLPILANLSSETEKEIYLRFLSKEVSLPLDILWRDLYNIAGKKQQKEERREEVIQEPNGNLDFRREASGKANQFVLASLVYKKDYAIRAFDMDLKFKNGIYQQLFDFLKKNYIEGKSITVSTLYDLFDCEGNPDLKEIVGYNFETVSSPNLYFDECIGKMLSFDLIARQNALKKEFNETRDANKRKEILLELGKISKELKNG